MSSDSARAARSRALAEKKAKLAELRRRRAARSNKNKIKAESFAEESGGASVSSASKSSASSKPHVVQRSNSTRDVDDLVDKLLATPAPGVLKGNLPQSHETPSTDSRGNADQGSSATKPLGQESEPKRINLSFCSAVVSLHISGRKRDCYSKGTQTEDSGPDNISGQLTNGNRDPPSPRAHHRSRSLSSSSTTAENGERGSETNPGEAEGAGIASKEVGAGADPVILTEQERRVIQKSEQYTSFLSQAASFIERTLSHDKGFDPTVIYGTREGEDEPSSSESELVLSSTIYDESFCAGRAVTDISWSPHYKELLLTAMHVRGGMTSMGLGSTAMDLGSSSKSPESTFSTDSDGLVLVWSLHRHNTPEFVFTCQSPVMTAKFDKFSSNLVVGATFSGQIVLWDTRAKSQPVQRTPLSASGHTHPVYSLEIVGSANANKLVTVSTDGRLCTWSLRALAEPSESTVLYGEKHDVAVTSIAFPDGEANEFCLGAEDGLIYAAQVHGQSDGQLRKYTGHWGPVTSLMFHPRANVSASTSGRANSLLLTSSVDWTVRLWSHQPRDNTNPLRKLAEFSTSREYVFDARWSPVHPSIFCYGDGAGMAHLWNINRDAEEPVISKQITGGAAVNKLRWSLDGKKIAIGDSVGKTHIVDIKSSLATARPEDWRTFDACIARLKEQS